MVNTKTHESAQAASRPTTRHSRPAKQTTPGKTCTPAQAGTPVKATSTQAASTPTQVPTPAEANTATQAPTVHDYTPVQAQASTPAPPSRTTPSMTSDDILSTLQVDISSLSEEGKAIVNIIIKAMQTLTHNKDTKIKQLQSKVTFLNEKVCDLENQIDELNQYERRDTIIVSGQDLPHEVPNENPTDVIVTTIKNVLNVEIEKSDINIAHRLGKRSSANVKKPIIVKLQSRQKKTDIISACISRKPKLFVNESLTPKRLSIFKTILNARRTHRDLFQQLYTTDGRIYVKLRCSNLKHVITNETTLNTFLDKFPSLSDNIWLLHCTT